MDERPVAFLDSGIGGIPYAHFFHLRNRKEKLLYIADRANFPYGPRSKENVIALAKSLVKKLLSLYNPKVLVVACNAISVSALKAIREEFSALPIVGTVPAIKPAAEKSFKRRIGVIGTQRAIDDPYIKDLAAKYGADCSIIGEAAPELVEFVERSWIAAGKTERFETARFWAEKFLAKGADVLVLACTHFLLLKDEFVSAGGNDLKIFDSLDGVIKRLESILDEDDGSLRRFTEKDAGEPSMLLTGSEPIESNWEQIASYFGFALEIMK
jgi:glutamate racemase